MKTTIIATGDAFITKNLTDYDGFSEISDVIKSYDVRFNNLEITVHDKQGYPAAFSGGTWAMTGEDVLDDLLKYGFNVVNTANNHSLDYSHGGLIATCENLEKRNIPYVGTGRNMRDASKPVYLKAGEATVALIGLCSTFHDSDRAGNASDEIQGRPGLNTLRFEEIYHVTPDEFEALKKIAKGTDINSFEDFRVKNGYAKPLPDGILNFGGNKFVRDESTFRETRCNKTDLARIVASVKEARENADIVLVSIHSHEIVDADPVIPAQFYRECCHACIDAGADAILGHGPHELRGVEMYNEKPIFYSLGNFIFQTTTVSLQPADAYENGGFPKGTTVKEYMAARSANNTKGYIVQPSIWIAAMAGITVEDGRVTDVTVHPIRVGLDEATKEIYFPTLDNGNEITDYLATLSAPFGTRFDNNKVVL